MATDHPEHEVEALGAALSMTHRPGLDVGSVRLRPRARGSPAQGLEERHERLGVRSLGVEPVDPQVLVVADDLRLVVGDRPSDSGRP